MPELSFANLIGGMLFGAIGFVAFYYGKKMHEWRSMFSGLALMVFPYFIGDTVTLYAAGALGTATLFLFRG